MHRNSWAHGLARSTATPASSDSGNEEDNENYLPSFDAAIDPPSQSFNNLITNLDQPVSFPNIPLHDHTLITAVPNAEPLQSIDPYIFTYGVPPNHPFHDYSASRLAAAESMSASASSSQYTHVASPSSSQRRSSVPTSNGHNRHRSFRVIGRARATDREAARSTTFDRLARARRSGDDEQEILGGVATGPRAGTMRSEAASASNDHAQHIANDALAFNTDPAATYATSPPTTNALTPRSLHRNSQMSHDAENLWSIDGALDAPTGRSLQAKARIPDGYNLLADTATSLASSIRLCPRRSHPARGFGGSPSTPEGAVRGVTLTAHNSHTDSMESHADCVVDLISRSEQGPTGKDHDQGTIEVDMDSGDSCAGATAAKSLSAYEHSGAVFLYRAEAFPDEDDVWKDDRGVQKPPIYYVPLSTTSTRKRKGQQDNRGGKRNDWAQLLQDPALFWPPGRVPGEIYAEIAGYLTRDEIKAMRLTCKEFERHTSHALFSTVVVPFNTEIYGMLEPDGSAPSVKSRRPKGKGRSLSADAIPLWKNAKSDDIYTGHGINVYRGFGPHIRRYGMSFEVDESSLARPPSKDTQQLHKSYWGSFSWPYQEYRRFERTADLELAADETPKMRHAFSFLTRVKELALSIDSGLGWLNGPDISIRRQVLGCPPPVFEAQSLPSDRNSSTSLQLWRHIKQLHALEGISDIHEVKLQQALCNFSNLEFEHLMSQHKQCHPDDTLLLSPHLLMDATQHAEDVGVGTACPDKLIQDRILQSAVIASGSRGILYTAKENFDDASDTRGLIVPNALTKLQNEWLLETEWAQCAFLSSYMIAIIDNPTTFRNVHTLTLARMSSRYLGMLDRKDFWESLPNLTDVTLKVLADWRDIRKDPAGFVESSTVVPSSATVQFHRLLIERIAGLEDLQHLTVGWASGGEHAEGICARNKHLLPAPFLPPGFLDEGVNHQRTEAGIVSFPYLRHLTIVNSWITPFSLTAFAKKHQKLQLSKLSLDSVSLTSPERVNNGPLQNQQGHQNAIAQLLQTLQAAHVANTNGNAAQNAQAGLPAQLLNQIQTQITHMQMQGGNFVLQQAIQLLPGAGNQVVQTALNNWVQNNNAGPANGTSATDWRSAPREGSWPWALDILSPGKNFSDFDLVHSNADNARVAASTLTEIELRSCGYAKVSSPFFDNWQVETPIPHELSSHFQKRHDALSPRMMKTTDTYIGEIVQYMPPNEMTCLQAIWNCSSGWEDTEKAEDTRFDGAMPGGTGRFNGRIRRSDRDAL